MHGLLIGLFETAKRSLALQASSSSNNYLGVSSENVDEHPT